MGSGLSKIPKKDSNSNLSIKLDSISDLSNTKNKLVKNYEDKCIQTDDYVFKLYIKEFLEKEKKKVLRTQRISESVSHNFRKQNSRGMTINVIKEENSGENLKNIYNNNSMIPNFCDSKNYLPDISIDDKIKNKANSLNRSYKPLFKQENQTQPIINTSMKKNKSRFNGVIKRPRGARNKSFIEKIRGKDLNLLDKLNVSVSFAVNINDKCVEEKIGNYERILGKINDEFQEKKGR